MNLKTSLKAVRLTLADLKLPVLGLLMLLFCITACNEHEVLPLDTSTESLDALNLTDEEAAFFSDEKINEMPHLKQAAKQLDNDRRGRWFFARSLQKTKRFVRDMNHQMEHKYIPHITQNVGQPVWLASYVAKLEGGDMMTFVPLVPADEAIINGVLVYQKTDDGDTSYSLTTREQMASVETETDDQNYPLLVQMFYEFDKQLFGAETEAYLGWGGKTVIELEDCSPFPEYTCLGRMTELPNRVITLFDASVFDTTPLSGLGTEFPCYYVCSAGCTADIYASGIADTEEETTWIQGNCSYADVIDDFLGSNNISDAAVTEAGQVLMDIGMAGVLNARQLNGLANALDALFDDPDNDENIVDFLEYFDNNGLDFFTLDAFGISNGTNLTPSLAPTGNWMDMRSGDFWAFTTGIYNGLVADYPSQEDRIDNWFSCRILGPAQEDACLTSLGLPLGNTLPAGFNRRPDGYIQRPIFDGWTAYQQPFFIEVKGKYGNSAPTEFDYMTPSGNFSPQFTDYLWYLNTNTHLPNCTAYHGLFMILPANVALADIVVDACSAYNVPLYRSGIEYNVDNQSEVRVQSPELLNIDGLFYTCYAFNFVGDYIMESALEHHMWLWFNYDAAIIPFAQKAQDFETSYLIPNVEPDPDPDECEGE